MHVCFSHKVFGDCPLSLNITVYHVNPLQSPPMESVSILCKWHCQSSTRLVGDHHTIATDHGQAASRCLHVKSNGCNPTCQVRACPLLSLTPPCDATRLQQAHSSSALQLCNTSPILLLQHQVWSLLTKVSLPTERMSSHAEALELACCCAAAASLAVPRCPPEEEIKSKLGCGSFIQRTATACLVPNSTHAALIEHHSTAVHCTLLR